MARHALGPRRSDSVNSYLRQTRLIAYLALLALVGGVVSDALAQGFWGHHALLAGLASSVIVVMFTVALVNEALERQRRRRWSVLAQYVMLELVRDSRLVWSGVVELAGLLPSDAQPPASIETGAQAVRDTPRLAAAVRGLLANADQRQQLHDEIAGFVELNDQVLGRWAAVMLNADAYAEVIDRHVELASEIVWVGSLLDRFEPSDDRRRWRRGWSHPAVQIEGELNDDQLADRIVAIAQLAERLDRGTLALSQRIVPLEWWAARLGADTLTSQSDRESSAAKPGTEAM
jgi:hypothetical protein